MNIILASASPRRRELLEQIGLSFAVIPAQAEELITKEKPWDIVAELAGRKADEIYRTVNEKNCLIIGADTVVSYEGRILGKPKDEEGAREMLSMLSGQTHEVYTGVALLFCKDGNLTCRSLYEKTEVTMYSISSGEIDAYIRSKEPMDKAGAYGIQGLAAKFVRTIDGDYNNVVGLPVARIYQEMKKLGIDISGNS